MLHLKIAIVFILYFAGVFLTGAGLDYLLKHIKKIIKNKGDLKNEN
jgi:hypothetical protein